MHSDPYSTFSEKLNAAAPYIPFGEMRNLVMNHTERRKSAFAAFFRYAAGFGLLLLIGGVWFVSNQSSMGSIAHPNHLTSRAEMPSARKFSNIQGLAVQHATVRNSIARYQFREIIPANNKILDLNQSKTDTMPTTVQNSTVLKSSEQKNTNVSKAAMASNSAPSIPSALIRTSERNEASNGNWSAFVSGGPMLSSNNFSTASMIGAIGVQYRLFGSSLLVVELRHSGFTQNHLGQNGGFQDTSVVAGGQIDKITIGTRSTIATTSTMFVNSLDLGYKYVLNPNDVLSPSAEILAGVSTSGFISLEAVGIEYRFARSLSLDMSARTEQLFSSNASPLGSLGLEATLGFQW